MNAAEASAVLEASINAASGSILGDSASTSVATISILGDAAQYLADAVSNSPQDICQNFLDHSRRMRRVVQFLRNGLEKVLSTLGGQRNEVIKAVEEWALSTGPWRELDRTGGSPFLVGPYRGSGALVFRALDGSGGWSLLAPRACVTHGTVGPIHADVVDLRSKASGSSVVGESSWARCSRSVRVLGGCLGGLWGRIRTVNLAHLGRSSPPIQGQANPKEVIVALKLRTPLAAVLVALALCASTAALAASSSLVVPPGGKVAGHTYSQWQAIAFQAVFSRTNGGPPCVTAHTPNGAVEMLTGGSGAAGTHTFNCSLPVGRPVYAAGLGDECSTADAPPFHATTPAQMKSCARRNYKGATNATASIDGKRVPGYHKLLTATGVFTFHLAKKNILGSKKRSGRGAAYGEGLLVTGFSRGSNRIDVTGAFPTAKYSFHGIYLLHVS